MGRPKSRTRQRKTDEERSCLSKTRYPSEVVATRESVRLGLGYYRCEHCGDFHLTSRLP